MKIAVIARQLTQCFDERAEQAGVTRAQWSLIATVSRHPGATQRLIATKLEVTDVTAGRLIDRLCADGYLERRPHPQDRRAYCVYITPAAQPVLELVHTIAEDYERDVFASLEEDDLHTLEALLETISQNLFKARGAKRLRDDMDELIRPGGGPEGGIIERHVGIS